MSLFLHIYTMSFDTSNFIHYIILQLYYFLGGGGAGGTFVIRWLFLALEMNVVTSVCCGLRSPVSVSTGCSFPLSSALTRFAGHRHTARSCSANEKTVPPAELASLPHKQERGKVRTETSRWRAQICSNCHLCNQRGTPWKPQFGKYPKRTVQRWWWRPILTHHWVGGRCAEVRTPGYKSLRSVEAVTPAIGSRSLSGSGAATVGRWAASGHSVVSGCGQPALSGRQHRRNARCVQLDSQSPGPSASLYSVDEVRITLLPSRLFLSSSGARP